MHCEVSNRLIVTSDEFPKEFTDWLDAKACFSNPDYHRAMARSVRAARGIPPEIQVYESFRMRTGVKCVSLPRGYWEEMNGWCGSVVANTTPGDPLLRHQYRHTKIPRDYQEDQVRSASKRPNSLWRAPPGSGKTTSALALTARLGLGTIVVTPNLKIFEQWVRRANEELGIPFEDIGVIQGKDRVIKPVTIASQQTLANCIDQYADRFGLYIGDEVQRHGAETFFRVTDKVPAMYRVGVSANERRADGKEFLIYALYGKPSHEVKREQLIVEGSIVPATIVMVPTKTRLPWYEKLSPLQRTDKLANERFLKEIGGDSSRNEIIMGLLEECGDEVSMLMTWRLEHCHEIRTRALSRGHRTGLMIGGKENAREFDYALEAMTNRELGVAVGTYQAVGVGVDIPILNRGVFATPCISGDRSQMQFEQFCGRYERPSDSKSDVVVYYVWDREIFGNAPITKLMKWKRRVLVRTRTGDIPVAQYLTERAL